MKLKFYFASFTALFLVLNGFAQKQNVYFLKNDGRYVNVKDSADYIRIVREPDSGTVLYNVLDYYLNGNRKMVGKSSTIDPITLEGTSASFYPNKKRKQVANYEKGYMLGVVYDYYQNGKLYRSLEYVDNKNRSPQPGSMGKQEIVHSVYDSSGVETVKDGNGHYQVYDSEYKILEEEGDMKDGKRNGVWKGTSNKGKISFTEEYADGKFIKGTSTDENGSIINYTVKEVLPTFRGGEVGFGNYLSRTLMYPYVAKQNNIQGRVIVSFVVEKNGQLTEIKILRDIGGGCGAEAARVIQQSPKWNPGIQRGIPVRVAYTMPINFALGPR